jgi:hypothetical protein
MLQAGKLYGMNAETVETIQHEAHREAKTMEFDGTTFQIRDESGAQISGSIEWGETVDTVRFTHPMTGELTEQPLQGWADAPGDDAHARTAAMVHAAQRDPEFAADHAGFEDVKWRFIDGHLCFEEAR